VLENSDQQPILKLEWHGPFEIGGMPANIEKLKVMKGLYVLHSHYELNGLDVIYVGSVTGRDRLRSIHTRIREHYGGILGFEYSLRDKYGKWDKNTDPEKAAFIRLGDLDKSLKHSVREARRLRFYYASFPDDNLHLTLQAESLLVAYLRTRLVGNSGMEIDNVRLSVGMNRIDLRLINVFDKVDAPLSRFIPSEISSSSLTSE